MRQNYGNELKDEPLAGQHCCLAPRLKRIRGGGHGLVELFAGCFWNTSEECLCGLLWRCLKSNKMRVEMHDELGPPRRPTVLPCSAQTPRL